MLFLRPLFCEQSGCGEYFLVWIPPPFSNGNIPPKCFVGDHFHLSWTPCNLNKIHRNWMVFTHDSKWMVYFCWWSSLHMCALCLVQGDPQNYRHHRTFLRWNTGYFPTPWFGIKFKDRQKAFHQLTQLFFRFGGGLLRNVHCSGMWKAKTHSFFSAFFDGSGEFLCTRLQRSSGFIFLLY